MKQQLQNLLNAAKILLAQSKTKLHPLSDKAQTQARKGAKQLFDLLNSKLGLLFAGTLFSNGVQYYLYTRPELKKSNERLEQQNLSLVEQKDIVERQKAEIKLERDNAKNEQATLRARINSQDSLLKLQMERERLLKTVHQYKTMRLEEKVENSQDEAALHQRNLQRCMEEMQKVSFFFRRMPVLEQRFNREETKKQNSESEVRP